MEISEGHKKALEAVTSKALKHTVLRQQHIQQE
jgi:hypothetical protein